MRLALAFKHGRASALPGNTTKMNAITATREENI